MIPLAARHRAMSAAEAVDTTTLREAAILGGVVRSVIACGRINVPWCSQYATDMLEAFRVRDGRTPIGHTETLDVIERFQASYSQPFPT